MTLLAERQKMNVPFGPQSHCAKFRKPPNGYRRRRHRSPLTPLVHWKFDDKQRASRGGGGVEMSARKLAAGLWQLRLLAQPRAGHVKQVLPFCRTSGEYVPGTKHLQQSPLPGCTPNHKVQHKRASSLPYPKSAMEGATKWEPRCSTTSTEPNCLYSHTKFLEGQFNTLSVVSALQAELSQARLRIHGLEDELRSSKMKFEHLLGKLGGERNSWQSKYNKMRAIIDNLKDELSVGMKSRERIDIINSKLVKELANSKSSEKQLMKDYEEEKMARELMEEVCNELANKIGEDKTEMEVLKSETFKFREELEEERRMLQLAEVWREERVQMKLVDARLALEYKYFQMNNLLADLEFFLRSRSENLDETELRKAELIIQAVKSVNFQDTKEFEYVPPKSSGIFSVFDENRQVEANERKMDLLMIKYNPVGDASNYDAISPEVNVFNNNHNNGFEEDVRVWASASHIEDQGSRYSFEGSHHSAIRAKESQLASRCKMECNEKVIQDSQNTEINKVCSMSGKQPRQKASSVSKFRRSLTSNGKFCKITSHEVHERLSNGTVSSAGTTSPRRKSVDWCSRLRQRDSVGQLVSSDSENPHITQGMKGFTEWPRGIQKNGSKAKCLKAT
ncbi:uncharacterized protein LOC116111777 [Pistacia vera]|uniref:uncharacterized protein LOC116105198 n=1 Tax=Pistacia vera TaxID=55513 RepID=UPI001262C893|nr:uncharacterized protein LOC116105198 [Pistacia vera]XP_031253783.1 uncharacterized protein LOC116111777 [Pistacia vera]